MYIALKKNNLILIGTENFYIVDAILVFQTIEMLKKFINIKFSCNLAVAMALRKNTIPNARQPTFPPFTKILNFKRAKNRNAC